MSSAPAPAKVPAIKRRESPVRNGVTRNPVSGKTARKSSSVHPGAVLLDCEEKGLVQMEEDLRESGEGFHRTGVADRPVDITWLLLPTTATGPLSRPPDPAAAVSSAPGVWSGRVLLPGMRRPIGPAMRGAWDDDPVRGQGRCCRTCRLRPGGGFCGPVVHRRIPAKAWGEVAVGLGQPAEERWYTPLV